MPEMPDETPWWGWLIVAVLFLIVPAITTWIVQRSNRAKMDHVVAETSPGHGGSMKDRLEQVVTTLADIKGDIIGLRRESRALAEADREDRAASVEAHKEIYATLAVDRQRYNEQHIALMAAVHANHQPPVE